MQSTKGQAIDGVAIALPTQRDREFYYPEGNIILAVVGRRESGYLFRVMKSQLAKHSEVFANMFNVPQPSDNDDENIGRTMEEIEGCAVVRMEDDAEDVRSTFRLLWDLPNRQGAPPSVLLGVLRISTKYIMPDVRSWVVDHLESIFPTGTEELLNPSHFEGLRQGQTAVDLILAGYNHDSPSFLPYAYFALATSEWSGRSKVQENGLSRLTQQQVLMLAVGRAFLQEQLGEALKGYNEDFIDFKPSKDCRAHMDCSKSGQTARHKTQGLLSKYVKHADLILWIKEAKEGLISGKWKLCGPSCRSHWITMADAKMNIVFNGFCEVVELASVQMKEDRSG
ncbi:hypothetical protein FRB93_002449 [Tulasnella sp. JGI-2019a]|nr:hypothetical protein FRB93_002449 [Tulasnella sp. JGI-2019a]